MSQDGPKMAPTWPKMVQDVCLGLSWAFIMGRLGRSLALPSLCLRFASLCLCFAFAWPLLCHCFAFAFQMEGAPCHSIATNGTQTICLLHLIVVKGADPEAILELKHNDYELA